MIKKFDKDGDGKLNDEEKAAAMKERGGRPGAKDAAGRGPGGATIAELIKKFDKDGDGKLSDQEKAAARDAVQGKRAEGRKKPE